MIAAFPMYLRAENTAAHDAFWSLIHDALRDRGIAAPPTLSDGADTMALWSRPDMVLSQICNLPYRAVFKDKITLIGAMDHGLPDARPGEYYSVMIARADDPRDHFADVRFALNDPLSNSGWCMPGLWAAARGTGFATTIQTGSHLASARAVAEGRADLAGIDAVTWQMLEKWEDFTTGLRVVGRTDPSPGISFCTAGAVDPAPYLAALSNALTALAAQDRETLALHGIIPLPRDRYLDLPIPAAPST